MVVKGLHFSLVDSINKPPMAPSHFLNRCWLLICEVLWHSSESSFKGSAEATILYNDFENYIFKIITTSPRACELKVDHLLMDITAGYLLQCSVEIIASMFIASQSSFDWQVLSYTEDCFRDKCSKLWKLVYSIEYIDYMSDFVVIDFIVKWQHFDCIALMIMNLYMNMYIFDVIKFILN